MILQTEAVVLHRMKYKNSSLIARIFTKDFCKMCIIINVSCKQKGNVFGIIEPPNIIKLNYYSTGRIDSPINDVNREVDLRGLDINKVPKITKKTHTNFFFHRVNNFFYVLPLIFFSFSPLKKKKKKKTIIFTDY